MAQKGHLGRVGVLVLVDEDGAQPSDTLRRIVAHQGRRTPDEFGVVDGGCQAGHIEIFGIDRLGSRDRRIGVARVTRDATLALGRGDVGPELVGKASAVAGGLQHRGQVCADPHDLAQHGLLFWPGHQAQARFGRLQDPPGKGVEGGRDRHGRARLAQPLPDLCGRHPAVRQYQQLACRLPFGDSGGHRCDDHARLARTGAGKHAQMATPMRNDRSLRVVGGEVEGLRPRPHESDRV